MPAFERLLHTKLFEIIALVILTLFAVFFNGEETAAMTGLAIALSLIAMGWNYLYNLLFIIYFVT